MRHVQDLVDEDGQARARLVDPLHVGALLRRLEVEVEECLGVPSDEGQRGPQFVADRRNEAFAQFLEGADGADIAKDGRRPGGRRRRGSPRSSPATRMGPAAPCTDVSR